MSHAPSLLEATVTALRSLDDELLDEFLALLPPDGRAEHAQPARALPVCATLLGAELNGSAVTRPVVDAFLRGIHRFAWNQTYTADDFGAAFLDRYGWVELVGERGCFHSARLLMSFLALGPETTYPAHRHAAEEIYVPLAGDALWMKSREPRGDFVPRQPGDIIHHPSMTWHAIETLDQPLIALALWRGGDLTEKSERRPEP